MTNREDIIIKIIHPIIIITIIKTRLRKMVIKTKLMISPFFYWTLFICCHVFHFSLLKYQNSTPQFILLYRVTRKFLFEASKPRLHFATFIQNQNLIFDLSHALIFCHYTITCPVCFNFAVFHSFCCFFNPHGHDCAIY